ncbi:lambda exonuclease family protein [Oerskovia enterophila]|uniref:lambda exonuclease family protein n=1 Tax=Oerskovia enterophila TaxID=43678 RepID=UPI0038080943
MPPIDTTLREYPNITQGTDEWRDLRAGIVTASTVGQLITPSTLKVASNETSRGLTLTLAAERITGRAEETPMTSDMWRGVENEPRARDKYAETVAPVRELGFMTRDNPFDGWALGYSPDGLVGDDGLIEIKSPRPKGHLRTILSDRVPSMYMAQLQAGLFVSGRQWIDYISYSGGMPMYVKRVEPDEEWFTAIKAAVVAFEKDVADMVMAYTEAARTLPATEYIEPFQEARV